MLARTPLRALFPAASVALDVDPGIWDREADPGTADGVRDLYNTIIFLENTSQDEGFDALLRTARALRIDLLGLAAQESPPIASADLHALLLATALGPARVGVVSGRVNIAYDWLLWSLTTSWDLEGEHEINFHWLASAATSHLDDATDEIVRPWLLTLYQYDWLTAGLPSVADQLLASTLAIAVHGLARADLDLAAVLLSWAGNRSLDTTVAAELKRIGGFFATIADNQALAPAIRLQALRPLALCVGTVTGQDQTQRSRQLLDEFGSNLSSTDRLGALGNVFTGKPGELADQIDTFIELALDHHRQFEAIQGTIAGMAWARGTRHSLVNVPIRTLLLDGRVEPAVRLLRAWRGLADNIFEGTQTLVGMLASPGGVTWVAEGGKPQEAATGISLVDFQTAANAYLGNTVAVPTSPGMALHVGPRGRGIPDGDLEAHYQTSAEAFLNLGAAGQARAAATMPPTSLLLLPTLQAPVQALMTRKHGSTLPLWMSLQQPAPDRRIRNALLYLGGSLFSPIEQEILVASLSAADVRLTLRTEGEMTRARFLDDYNSQDFDLIWVGTHGIYDGLQPDNAHLHLSRTEQVRLNDLQPPASVMRRLLVLNACDGAVTAQTGGIGEMGLAAVAASANQAVISHQWPVASSTTALLFAGVLATSLTRAPSFFEAYQSMMSLVGGESRVLRDQVATISQRLVRLLDDKPEDFESLSSWGSAAFVQ
ncbi:CHAT domain-containing protein [Pedococcus sp. P5_B7]